MLDPGLDQTRMRGRARIHSEGVKAKLGEPLDQPAIAAADVQDPRPVSDHRRDNPVEVLPPSVRGHWKDRTCK